MKIANEPAFPAIYNTFDAAGHVIPKINKGLSILEYYAGVALQGMLASYDLQCDVQQFDPRYNGQNFAEVMAKNAVEFANALIAELEK